jgi:hypothetical protein
VAGRLSWLENNISSHHFFPIHRKLIVESFRRALDSDRYMRNAIWVLRKQSAPDDPWLSGNFKLYAIILFYFSPMTLTFVVCVGKLSLFCLIFCMFLNRILISCCQCNIHPVSTSQHYCWAVEPNVICTSYCHTHTHCVLRSAQPILSMKAVINLPPYWRMSQFFNCKELLTCRGSWAMA